MPDDHGKSLFPPAPPLQRRGFLGATVAAGYTLAAGPIQAQTLVRTDTQGLTAGDVMIATPKGTMGGYRAKPAGRSNLPVVIVMMEVFGLHEWVKDVCRRFAKAGYLAVSPDYYFRQGKLEGLTDFATQIGPIVSKKPDDELLSDLDYTATWAASDGGDLSKLGVTGFCRGGRNVIVYTAHSPRVKAAVAWYGGNLTTQTEFLTNKPVDVAARIKAPLLGLYAGDDPGIPPEHVEQLKAALAKSGQKWEMVVYPGAKHGFLADYRASYSAEASAQAWPRCLAWFKANGVG
ncbi:MAG: dienelactone hydrolase family protein [Alphaproteobacteria bacterium]|nr:dienelactone hydrolase family protein [Alphaproteobacteria bacterium]